MSNVGDVDSRVTMADMVKGRVLMLNPAYLKPHEIIASPEVKPLGGNSPHYFMCVSADNAYGYWCPLSSKQKPVGIGTKDGQGYIKSDSKLGFPHFQNCVSWFDTGQVWKILNTNVIEVACSERCNRREPGLWPNHVAESLVDKFFPE